MKIILSFWLKVFFLDLPNNTLAINNLTCSLINSILSGPFKWFLVSYLDFDLLMKTLPIKLELPVDSKRLA